MDVLARYDPLVEDFTAFRAACQTPLPSVVRVNPIKTSVDRATAALDAEGIGWTRCEWHPRLLELETDAAGGSWPYFLGWLYGQEEVSALPGVCLDPAPGERVWDAAAAPGSKSTQLAEQMDDSGMVIANDKNLGRLSALRANSERLGLTSLAVTNQDARNFSFQPFPFESVDGALVDAPCSGEGTIRKNPTALEEWSESFLRDIAGVQRDILARAVQATTPGGRVVYSTCTFAPEENEAVLDAVLESEHCQLVEVDCPIDSRPGISEWQGDSYAASVRKAHRIWPHLNDTGGFFLAVLEVGE